MSYLVLARKYRPTTFAQVVGQDHVTRTLANAFAASRVHHAFLFCGPRGCGKTTLARIVGKALNCERGIVANPGSEATAEPCGECAACISIGSGSAVDYVEMDGASNRGIDAIRELTEAVRYQPAILRKKVYVIDEVHMLTTEAFNALLKTLEEPPPHITFVLATTEAHKLPNTILSRCQRYDFKLVAASKLANHLAMVFAKEGIEASLGAIGLIVRESGGSVRDSLSLSDQIISYVGDKPISELAVAEVLGVADRTLTRSLVTALATGDAAGALAAVEAGTDRGVDETQIARAVVRYLRDLAVLQAAPTKLELVDASEQERSELAAEAKSIAASRVQQMFARMIRCCDELGKTLLPRLVLDCALIEVATLEPLVPLGDLIERLGEMEQRLARGGGGVGGSGPGNGATERTLGAGPGAGASGGAKSAGAGTSASAAPASRGPNVRADAAPPVWQPPVSTVAEASSPPPKQPPTVPVAAPSSPAAPHPVPQSAQEQLEAWDRVLVALETKRKLSLLGYYQHSRVLAWRKDGIDLGFATEFHSMGEMAKEREQLEEMRQFVREHLGAGAAFTLTVKLLDERESQAIGPRSVLETDRERQEKERVSRENEARSHPMIQHVVKAFEGQIREIRTDV